MFAGEQTGRPGRRWDTPVRSPGGISIMAAERPTLTSRQGPLPGSGQGLTRTRRKRRWGCEWKAKGEKGGPRSRGEPQEQEASPAAAEASRPADIPSLPRPRASPCCQEHQLCLPRVQARVPDQGMPGTRTEPGPFPRCSPFQGLCCPLHFPHPVQEPWQGQLLLAISHQAPALCLALGTLAGAAERNEMWVSVLT